MIDLSLVNFYFDRLKLSIILIKLLIRIVFQFFGASQITLLIAFAAMVVGKSRLLLAELLIFDSHSVEEQLPRLQLVRLRWAGLLEPIRRLTVTIFTMAAASKEELLVGLSCTAAAPRFGC